jgi:hypothetical protein
MGIKIKGRIPDFFVVVRFEYPPPPHLALASVGEHVHKVFRACTCRKTAGGLSYSGKDGVQNRKE